MPKKDLDLHLPKLKRNVLLRCMGLLKPYWKKTAGAYATMVIIDLIAMVNPQLIRWAVDSGLGVDNSRILLLAVGGMLVLVVIKGFLTYLQGLWTEIASQSVAYDLRNQLQKKITDLSFSFHDQSEAGDLLSRAIQDVERIRFLTGRASYRIIEGIFLLILTAVAMFIMNPWLGLLGLLFMPLLAVQSAHFGKKYRPLSSRIQKQLAVLTTRVEQNLRGVRVVKTFAQQEAEIERFEKENQDWFSLAAYGSRLQSTNMPALTLISNLASVAMLLVGGYFVIRQSLSLGVLVAFTTYMAQLISPMRFFGMILPAISMASASAERVFEILDKIPDVQESPGAKTLRIKKGEVRFDNVSFSYGLQGGILNGISFEAHPNQVIALLGPTGSGKSTVINLIPRFYDPTEGCIFIDRHDIRTVTLNSLRSQIGIVLQETDLFSSTISENISFGRPGATREEIETAARIAQAHDFIMQMKDGYETHVAEKGSTLSGGQKQRIAIARALLLDPRILILDDATSSVDAGTEQLIQTALENVMKNRTTFVIAHRLSTVQQADVILLLDKGTIVARGKHADLLSSSSLYQDIYRRQLSPREAHRI